MSWTGAAGLPANGLALPGPYHGDSGDECRCLPCKEDALPPVRVDRGPRAIADLALIRADRRADDAGRGGR